MLKKSTRMWFYVLLMVFVISRQGSCCFRKR